MHQQCLPVRGLIRHQYCRLKCQGPSESAANHSPPIMARQAVIAPPTTCTPSTCPPLPLHLLGAQPDARLVLCIQHAVGCRRTIDGWQ